MRPLARRILSAACLALSAGGGAAAQGLSDPTRPPDHRDAGGAVNTAAAEPGEPVLQAVVLERNRKYAVISGRIVKLGDRYDGARLVQIGESEVVLRDGRNLKRLKLVPGIDKKPAGSTAQPRERAR